MADQRFRLRGIFAGISIVKSQNVDIILFFIQNVERVLGKMKGFVRESGRGQLPPLPLCIHV